MLALKNSGRLNQLMAARNFCEQFIFKFFDIKCVDKDTLWSYVLTLFPASEIPNSVCFCIFFHFNFRISSICAKSDNELIATKIGFSSVNFVPISTGEKESEAKVTMTTLVKPTLTTIPESKVFTKLNFCHFKKGNLVNHTILTWLETLLKSAWSEARGRDTEIDRLRFACSNSLAKWFKADEYG